MYRPHSGSAATFRTVQSRNKYGMFLFEIASINLHIWEAYGEKVSPLSDIEQLNLFVNWQVAMMDSSNATVKLPQVTQAQFPPSEYHWEQEIDFMMQLQSLLTGNFD